MTTATITGRDQHLRDAVLHQLEWDPEVDASAIGVTAKDGVVTLTGFVDTYAGKLSAERISKAGEGHSRGRQRHHRAFARRAHRSRHRLRRRWALASDPALADHVRPPCTTAASR